jgi:hypothetical protein
VHNIDENMSLDKVKMGRGDAWGSLFFYRKKTVEGFFEDGSK